MQIKQVQKEIIVRIYSSSIDSIKNAVRKIASLNGVTPSLFGKDNEYIVQINVLSGGEAAATQLANSAAEIIEKELGDNVYGRGKKSLAHIAAGALISSEAQLCAASAELGDLLFELLTCTSRGQYVFDNGELSYSSKKSEKIKASAKTIQSQGVSSLAYATELALAARKIAGVRYGSALSNKDEDGRRWMVVTDKDKVYARQMQANESTRAAALAVLDLVRRLALNVKIEQITAPAKNFNQVAHKAAITATALVLMLSIFLGSALFYYYSTYYMPSNNNTEAVQAY